MKKTLACLGAAMSLGLTLVVPAMADGGVSCDKGVFAANVENREPVGGAAEIAAAHRAVYFLVVKNPGEAATLSLVWKLDGTEVQRQTLDIGKSPAWKTWAFRPTGAAKVIEVDVLNEAGESIKQDKLELSGAGS